MFTAIRAAAVGFAVAAGAFLNGPVRAEIQQQWDWCQGEGGVAKDVQIRACTVLIYSGTLAEKDLAWAYYNRGVSYGESRDYARAIHDFDESIRLEPTDADTFWLRHAAKESLGDMVGAEVDSKVAKRLNPKKYQ